MYYSKTLNKTSGELYILDKICIGNIISLRLLDASLIRLPELNSIRFIVITNVEPF